jgi:hypothetical protein
VTQLAANCGSITRQRIREQGQEPPTGRLLKPSSNVVTWLIWQRRKLEPRRPIQMMHS